MGNTIEMHLLTDTETSGMWQFPFTPKKYFNEHYNEDINIEEYTQKNYVSISWFIRAFKQCTGSTPMQYILSKRISNAETLLLDHSYNITEIAQIVGYDNPLYFSRIFKKIKGLSPSEYRKNINTN